jgi:SAM-dependent methyltransferase
MDSRLQRRIQRYGWNKAVNYYEQYWRQQLAPAQTRLIAMADLQRGERVLDVACGTGIVTFRAAALVGPAGSVVGTNIAENMVETARQAATERRLHQVTLARMDAEDLQFPDGVFDAGLCALGLMYVPDPGRALQQRSGASAAQDITQHIGDPGLIIKAINSVDTSYPDLFHNRAG